MKLRQLRYFVKIAEMGSMSRASRVLHISQPSLSQQVAQLEEEVGTLLFTRIPSGVSMTIEGEALYRQALHILRQVNDLPRVVNEAQSRLSGTISVAFVYTQAAQYGLPLLVKLRERYPGIQLELFDSIGSEALQSIANGRQELGLLANSQDAALLDSVPIFEEELYLVSHPQQAPAGHSISLSEVSELTLILPSPSQMDDKLSALAEAYSRSSESDPMPGRKWMLANSVPVFRQAVLAGVAHAFQPWGAVREEVMRGAMKATSIEPRMTRKIYLSTARGASISQVARAVRQVLLEVVREEWERGNVKGRLLGDLVEPREPSTYL